MAYEKELEIAIRAAVEASQKILDVYSEDFSVKYKSDQSPVTQADLVSGKAIEAILRQAFPNDGFVSEEEEDDGSRLEKKRFWVIDPLDGTKEFVKKNDEFAINIALVDGESPVLGLVYVPVTQTIYYGVKGQGAFKKDQEGLKEIRVSDRINPLRVLVSRSHPSPKTHALISQLRSRVERIQEMGSSIKGCLIAEGAFDLYYNFGKSMKWDTCALECIVSEAGGLMKKLDGHPIDYNEQNKVNQGFFIINRKENYISLEES